MEETRDALQEEFDLIEHQNGPTEKRIDLLKKVQDSLHQEAEFLRSIGADQKKSTNSRTSGGRFTRIS